MGGETRLKYRTTNKEIMIWIEILKTKEVKGVDRHEAHRLIDSGVAKLFVAPKDKMLRPKRRRKGGYKTK